MPRGWCLRGGWRRWRNDDLALGEAALGELRERLEGLAGKAEGYSGIEATRAVALELEGLLDLARGRERAGLEALRKATAVEEAMPLAYGPPAPLKPSHELFGEVLLGLGRFQDAAAQFGKALERAPRRALSLLGAARAAAGGGDAAAAKAYYAELRDVWSGAGYVAGAGGGLLGDGGGPLARQRLTEGARHDCGRIGGPGRERFHAGDFSPLRLG